MAEDETGITPDWTTPYGITTPRIDTPVDYIVGGFGGDNNNIPPYSTQDCGKRTESGDEAIWEAYEEGY